MAVAKDIHVNIVATMHQVPSIGRVVHYQSYGTPGGEYLPCPRAAIITDIPVASDVDSDAVPVSLCVLNPTGMFFTALVPFSAEGAPGHWSWPPRV